MKGIAKITILAMLVGMSLTGLSANARSACLKQCDSASCSSNSPSVCAKQKQDCRNKCPR